MLTGVAMAAQEAATEGGLAALGLNVRAFVFQLVNFAILFAILYKFAYRPLLRILENRRTTIEESLRSAGQVEQTRKDLVHEQRSILADAHREAEHILQRSKKEGKDVRDEAEHAGQVTAEQIMAEARAKIAQDVIDARQSLKRTTMELVVAATENILHRKLGTADDQRLIEEAITEARKTSGQGRHL